MGTTAEQPITTQANFILKHIIKTEEESMVTLCADMAIDEEKELDFVLELAFQIKDHPKEGYILFNQALDAWIVEVSEIVNSRNNENERRN